MHLVAEIIIDRHLFANETVENIVERIDLVHDDDRLGIAEKRCYDVPIDDCSAEVGTIGRDRAKDHVDIRRNNLFHSLSAGGCATNSATTLVDMRDQSAALIKRLHM